MRIVVLTLMLVLSLAIRPVAAQVPPDAKRPDPKAAEISQLLDGLALAPSDDVAAKMERRIATLWSQQGGPTAAMMMARGSRNLQAGDAPEAVADLDSVLVLAPNLPAALVRRGAARFDAGDIPGAIRDLQAALSREPRQFEALQTLSHIAETQENWLGALAAWRRLLEIDPHTAGAQPRLKELTKKVEGEES
jgi:tetratricopeptide (TPR) repeat protein